MRATTEGCQLEIWRDGRGSLPRTDMVRQLLKSILRKETHANFSVGESLVLCQIFCRRKMTI
jgi:hypothetical protein